MLKLYSIYDRKLGIFHEPLSVRQGCEADFFKRLFNDMNLEYYSHVDDYQIYYLADFDFKNGGINKVDLLFYDNAINFVNKNTRRISELYALLQNVRLRKSVDGEIYNADVFKDTLIKSLVEFFDLLKDENKDVYENILLQTRLGLFSDNKKLEEV